MKPEKKNKKSCTTVDATVTMNQQQTAFIEIFIVQSNSKVVLLCRQC